MDHNAATIISNTVIEAGNEFITDSEAMDQDNKMVIEIDKMLDKLEPPQSSECCIYRVPPDLRKLNEEAYTPSIVSIGPFHHGNKNLESMDKVKKRYMKKLVRRSGNSSLRSCFDFVKKREKGIRDCYSEHIEMDSDEFVLMILVDSCFIIQFLILSHNNWENDDDHSLSLVPMMRGNMHLDLTLLENQVPFFVLEGLFSLATSASSEAFSLLHLALDYINRACDLYFFEEFDKHNNAKLNFQSIKHFTHLLLILFQPPAQEPSPPQKEKFRGLCSATNLTEAGVTFRKKMPCKGLFDITFTNEVLEIPSFSLFDGTKIEMRNLIALEHCHYPKDSFISDFFIFMDCLINTTRDVDLLVDKKIIINDLGSNQEAADFFNNLCINVILSEKFYFSHVCKELNDYYEVPTHRLKAMLKRDYFDTPWQTASTIAAITLLILTFIQTVCSIISTVYRN